MPAVNCQKTTKKKVNAALCRAAESGGEAGFNAAKTAYNSFIGTLAGTATAVVAVIEPILEIDKIVIDTFVRPPLSATVQLLESTTKTMKVPLRILGSLDGGECAKFHTGLRKGTDAVATFITRDYNKLANVADELDEWLGDRTELIEELKLLADTVSSLEVEEDYQEFITRVCQTI